MEAGSGGLGGLEMPRARRMRLRSDRTRRALVIRHCLTLVLPGCLQRYRCQSLQALICKDHSDLRDRSGNCEPQEKKGAEEKPGGFLRRFKGFEGDERSTYLFVLLMEG